MNQTWLKSSSDCSADDSVSSEKYAIPENDGLNDFDFDQDSIGRVKNWVKQL